MSHTAHKAVVSSWIEGYEELPLHSTKYDVCPVCDGGTHRRKTFSITRVEEGYLYICFRATCGIKGFIHKHFNMDKLTPKKAFTPKYFEGELESLVDNPHYLKLMAKNYDIEKATIIRNRIRLHMKEIEYINDSFTLKATWDNRIPYWWIPLFTHEGYNWGGILKKANTNLLMGPKVISYVWQDVPRAHFPLPEGWRELSGGPVVLVEDALSAIRLSQDGLQTCALLGTNLSPNVVSELLSITHEIFLILDLDTWEKGIPTKLTQKYGGMFESFTPVRIEKDIKDMNKEEYKKFLATTFRGDFND